MGSGLSRTECACLIALSTCVSSWLSAVAVAQQPGDSVSATQRNGSIMIGGKPAPAPSLERCIEVEIGHDRALGCLNQQLKREVDRVNPTLNMPPLDARSSDVSVGLPNEAAVRQQYGPNYGRSVQPFRPPTPVFTVPRH